MLNFIKFLHKKPMSKQSPPEPEILNSGLSFAMEFGENWLQPIQKRLLSKYDFLTSRQLDEYNATCTATMKNGHQFIYKSLADLFDSEGTIKESQLKENFKNFMLNEYPWIDKGNISRLFSQGCYYAYKDGLTDCLK